MDLGCVPITLIILVSMVSNIVVRIKGQNVIKSPWLWPVSGDERWQTQTDSNMYVHQYTPESRWFIDSDCTIPTFYWMNEWTNEQMNGINALSDQMLSTLHSLPQSQSYSVESWLYLRNSIHLVVGVYATNKSAFLFIQNYTLPGLPCAVPCSLPLLPQ